MNSLIYVVEQSGLSNSQNKIANERDKVFSPNKFHFVRVDEIIHDHLESVDFLILEDEAKNQMQLLKAVADLREIKKTIICDNLDIFSILIDKIENPPKVITIDYKIGSVRTTEKLPLIYKNIKLKFRNTSVLGYTNYALIKKDSDFSESSADELTRIIRQNGDSVLSKAEMNEKVMSAIIYDRLQLFQFKQQVARSKSVIEELKSEQKVTSNILDHFLSSYTESRQFSKLSPPMIGESASIRTVKYFIEVFSKDDSPVFITGESGTGKELVARAIHLLGRPNQPFIDVSPAIPEELIESELFGHEKGAFTNALNQRIGKFEQANKGVLFLDEIADISLNVQAKILRAIQEKTIIRVGGTTNIPIDVKLITATNKDIHALISAGLFREDLLYRINSTFPKLPSLRDRAEDIPLLVRHFLTTKRSDLQFTNDTISYLQSLPWMGNVRELKQVVEQTNILYSAARKRLVDVSDIQLVIAMLNKDKSGKNEIDIPSPSASGKAVVEDCSAASIFLDKIQDIVVANFDSAAKVNQNDIIKHFITKTGQTGVSRQEFIREYFSPHKNCIERLIANNETEWKEIRQKCAFIRNAKSKK